MYQVKVQRQNKITAMLCALLCAGGVGLFAISLLPGLPFPFFAQGMGVLALTFGVLFYAKYILHTYYYNIRPSGIFDADGAEIIDLEVVDEIGKRRTTVCRIGLRDMAEISARPARATKKNGQTKLRARDGGRIFYYCADLFPEKILAVYTTDGNLIVLTFDQQLYNILRTK